MEGVAIGLLILLFGSAAMGKDITIIHISTPPRTESPRNVTASILPRPVPFERERGEH